MTRRYGHMTSTIFSLCCCLFLRTVYSQLPQDQSSIMVSLYDMIQNNTGTVFAWNGTNRGSNPCSWVGVSCTPNYSSITKISLRKFSISSSETLPLLCGIKSLESIDVSDNQLNSIPDKFITGCGAGMSGLTQLLLANNQLSGVVPAFPKYVKIDLGGNNNLIFPPPALWDSSPVGKTTNTLSNWKVIIIFISGGFIFGISALVIVRLVLRNQYKVRGNWLIDGHHIIHKSQLDFCKAMAATRRPSNIVLKTEWYTYYRAVMPCGIKYCIKKINSSSKAFTLHNPKKFVEELITIARLTNRDIMIPLAYALTSHSAFIFYEFPEFGSLFSLLHEDKDNVLDWKCRFSIVLGISRGLNFLHGNGSENAPRILLNLSPRSIMMKSLLEPIIGDLELSNVIRPSQCKGTPSVVAGAVGFIPPEYAYTMRVTTSGNIYSFGVIMLELLTGKPAVYEGLELANWVTSRLDRPENQEILDSRVSGTSAEVQHQMFALLRIALRCISVSPSERPEAEALHEMLLDLDKCVGM